MFVIADKSISIQHFQILQKQQLTNGYIGTSNLTSLQWSLSLTDLEVKQW